MAELLLLSRWQDKDWTYSPAHVKKKKTNYIKQYFQDIRCQETKENDPGEMGYSVVSAHCCEKDFRSWK